MTEQTIYKPFYSGDKVQCHTPPLGSGLVRGLTYTVAVCKADGDKLWLVLLTPPHDMALDVVHNRGLVWYSAYRFARVG